MSTRWQSRRICTHLLLLELQNYNSLLNSCQKENAGSHPKKIPHVQGQRRSTNKMVGGTKSHLESNPIPASDVRRAQTKLVHTRTQRPHRNWARTMFECLLQRYGSVVWATGAGESVQQTCVWHKPSWRRSPLMPPSVQWLSCVWLFAAHEPQHARPPYPSPTSRVYTNPCPSSHWCYPTISSSGAPFSSCPQYFPGSGSFQMSQLIASGGQSIGVSASTSVLAMNTQGWSPLGCTGWISLQSKGLSRVFSNTTVQKHQFFSAQFSL